MSRTRNLADLLDGNGDVKSAALDNVPPSNDASALTTGTLPAARLPTTIDGRDVSADGAKLDGIEVGATADQSAAQIKSAYESNANTNPFTDSLQTKLSGIEAGANVNQTAAEIKTAYESNSDTNPFSDALLSKLNGIAAGATNVTNTNQLTNGAGFVTTDTNTTYSAGNGLSLSGTQFNLGGNSIKQLKINSPSPGVIAKSGGWSEVTTSLRTSITCVSGSSSLIVNFTFVYGGNNNSQIGAFAVRDMSHNFFVNLAGFQSRAGSHGTTRHRDHDVNDVEMITVTALIDSSQTYTSNTTYSLYHRNEGSGGVAKYFFGWGQNLSQGFYAKPVCTIMEV